MAFPEKHACTTEDSHNNPARVIKIRTNSKINEVFHGLHHIINVMNGKIALYNHNTTQRCLYRMSKHAPRGISRGLPDPQGILSYQIKKTRALRDSPGRAIMQIFFCVSVSWNINQIRTQHLLLKVTNTNLVVELTSGQNWKDQSLPIHQYMTHGGAFFYGRRYALLAFI